MYSVLSIVSEEMVMARWATAIGVFPFSASWPVVGRTGVVDRPGVFPISLRGVRDLLTEEARWPLWGVVGRGSADPSLGRPTPPKAPASPRLVG